MPCLSWRYYCKVKGGRNYKYIQVSDLGLHGLKAQQHIAQGKRSGTLGNSFSANFALKEQKLERNQIMLLPLQGDIPNGYIPWALALGYVLLGFQPAPI